MSKSITSVPLSESGATPVSREEKLRREKETLVADVADARLNTLMARVAWILNHYPHTRDSDVALQIAFWSHFDRDHFNGRSLEPETLFRLTRLTSIARARAKIQNQFGLFLASEEVRARRGTLEEEEREHHREALHSYPSTSIYADESGKTSEYLVVGSVWLLNGILSLEIHNAVEEWRESTGIREEIHFQRVSDATLQAYLDLLEVLYAQSAALGFKAIRIVRKGIGDQNRAIEDLLYHLIVRGMEHELGSLRSSLPRVLTLWKDEEEESRDRLMMANLRARLEAASIARFGGQLHVTQMLSVSSKKSVFIQLADLFVNSLNRTWSSTTTSHAKDIFAKALLERFGSQGEEDTTDDSRDVLMIKGL